jgi:hypothetical protein
MSTRNIKIIMFLGSKVQPVRRADNQASKACYGIALLLVRGNGSAFDSYLERTTFETEHAVALLVAGSFHDEFAEFFNLSNPSSRITVLESAQPLIEISTRNFNRGKGRPERKSDNLTAIYESRLSRKCASLKVS